MPISQTLGFYILQTLTLAVIYNTFRAEQEESEERHKKLAEKALEAAFKELDVNGRGYVSISVVGVVSSGAVSSCV